MRKKYFKWKWQKKVKMDIKIVPNGHKNIVQMNKKIVRMNTKIVLKIVQMDIKIVQMNSWKYVQMK